MEPTIIFDNVSKKFSKGYFSDSLRDAVAASLKHLFSKNGSYPVQQKKEFWALKDVSFEVRSGEALGIIGPNGSGKSTTLKLLSRILRPDGGKVVVKGRVGALIELAAGFHPDLTGRENVFLNALILGMDKKEIERKYDEIVDFAELQEFMDTPVKWYSSGMYARLGFAVAAHIDPEILLVDEVLSVGDIGFQQKCEKKIQSIKEKGLTIVFVSHNMSAISAVCDRVTVLHKGEMVFCGSPGEAIKVYTEGVKTLSSINERSILIQHYAIKSINGNTGPVYCPGDNCEVNLKFRAIDDLEKINVGIHVRKKDTSAMVFGSNYTALTGKRISLSKGQELSIAFNLSLYLAQGIYAIDAIVWDQLRNRPLVKREIDSIIVRHGVKTEGVAFLKPEIAAFSITGEEEIS